MLFFVYVTSTTVIYTLSLHDALPISIDQTSENARGYNLFNSASFITPQGEFRGRYDKIHLVPFGEYVPFQDRKSTRLNSSHLGISYAVFRLKKQNAQRIFTG